MEGEVKLKESDVEEKNLLNFINKNESVFVLIGMFLAMFVYFSNFANESKNNISLFNNLGFGVILIYILLLVLIILIIIESYTGKYDNYTIIFCCTILLIFSFLSSVISSNFQQSFRTFMELISFGISSSLGIYLMCLMQKNKKIKIGLTFYSFVALILLCVFIDNNCIGNNILLSGIFGGILFFLTVMSMIFLFKHLPIEFKKRLRKFKKWKNKI